jgi:hypothetical protein
MEILGIIGLDLDFQDYRIYQITCWWIDLLRLAQKPLCLRADENIPSKLCELVSLAGKIFHVTGKHVSKIRIGLDAVVKNNNRSILGGPDRIAQAFGRGQTTVKVAAEHIPHDQLVIFAQGARLLAGHAAVRGPEQPGRLPDLLLAKLSIINIGGEACSPTVEVIKRMVSYRVASFCYLPEHFRVLADVVADTEKGGLGPVAGQYFQNPLRYPGNGPVVEGQINFFFPAGPVPGIVRPEVREKERILVPVHLFLENVCPDQTTSC